MRIKLSELKKIIKAEFKRLTEGSENNYISDIDTHYNMSNPSVYRHAASIARDPLFRWEIGMQAFDQLDDYYRLEDANDVEDQYVYRMRQVPDITDAETIKILEDQGIMIN